MSSFHSLYRRGLVSMATGPALVAVGLVTGIHLMALAGVAVLGWGIYRFRATRAAGR
jgi:hypothetical protein